MEGLGQLEDPLDLVLNLGQIGAPRVRALKKRSLGRVVQDVFLGLEKIMNIIAYIKGAFFKEDCPYYSCFDPLPPSE